jgi:taurine dioxygenase
MNTLTVTPVREDISFGARVGGVTPETVQDDVVRKEINEIFERYGLLIFEDMEPTPKMQVALSNVFGPLKDHPSQAVARAGGDDMLGVIEMRHDPG